jgi:adenylate cyclase
MEKLGQLLTSTWAVVISAALLVAVYVWNPSAVEILRLKTFDYLITSLEPKQSQEIVLVEFGEKSVEKYGQWPFDRRDIANTIKKLRESNAGVIVAPILFSEKDRAGGDQALIDVLKENGVVVAQTPTTQRSNPDAARRGFAAIGPDPRPWTYTWNGAIPPLPGIAVAADGVGLLATFSERDGVVRRLPMLARIVDVLYPSIVLEALRVAASDPSYQIKSSEAGIEFVRIPQYPPIATDEHGRIWLSWNTKFKRIDATEIESNFEKITEKIVVLGLTIEGVGGIIGTPIGETWAHEIQAQALQTVIDGTTITRLSYANIVELLLILLLLSMLLFLVPRTSVKWTVPLYAFFVASIIGGAYYAFAEYMQLWDPSYLVVSSTIVFGHLIYNNFARENRLKLQIKKQFGTYLSPALVEKLQKDPSLLKLGGETRELSIMFTDVRGFTTISEHYGSDVQGLTQIMNRYMTAMTQKILENEGTLDKYIGDAQMAFWNAPLDDAAHAKHAVKTALEMLGSLDAFNREIQAEGVPPFGMGLGINTGSVVVGNMGSSQRFDYTCLGDSVNLASRLEGQSKPYHVKMVIGPKTYEYVKDDYLCLELDCLAVKGKTEGVNIYTIVNKKPKNIADSRAHNLFIKAYRSQNWYLVKDYAKSLKNSFDGDMKEYYDMMLERVEEYIRNPLPADWDGVFRTNSK